MTRPPDPAHLVGDRPQRGRRMGEHAVGREDAVGDERADAMSVTVQVLGCHTRVRPEDVLQTLVAAAQPRIGRVDEPYMGTRRRAGAERRRERRDAGRDAVICVFCCDQPRGAGVVVGDAHGEIVRFRAAARVRDAIQRAGKRRQKLLGRFQDRALQVSRIRVQDAELPRHGLHDLRMAVPDLRDIVVRVEVLDAVPAVQEHISCV